VEKQFGAALRALTEGDMRVHWFLGGSALRMADGDLD